jgi:ribosome-binding protein aMBF1 (putative translation factor)
VKAHSNRPRKNICGNRIRQARLTGEPTMTQNELADKLLAAGLKYVNQSVVSRMESRRRYVNDMELIALSRILKVTVGWLCGERLKKS